MTQDRYKYFRIEAHEILEQLGQSALGLEKGSAGSEVVARLLRLAHTLKGAARVVKQAEIADRAHALEDALAPFQDGSSPVPRDRIDRAFSLIDEIGSHIARLAPAPAVTERARSDAQEQPPQSFRPAVDDLDALLTGVLEAHVRLSALRPRLIEVERARQAASLVVDQMSGPRDSEAFRAAGQTQNEKARSMATDLRGMLDALERELTSSVDQLDRELRHVREAAERLRLAPAGTLFTFLELAVRDAAKALDKRVVFEASGGDVRVDTFVLNVIQGALLHMVRNAVTHGIEAGNAGRKAAGKAVEGRVTLRVVQRGALVSFSCTDDGRGVDLDAVRRIALEKGIALEADRKLGPEELLRVLMAGGLSTSGTVTDLSGRGIGLDVVREAAERLGGIVTLQTDAGKGTTVEVVVPLSVASFRALLVEASGGTIAIPLDSVCGSVRLAREDVIRSEQSESVVFDGQAIPLGSLSHLLSATGASSRSALHASAVVVRGQTGLAACTVDRLIGLGQVIMRPLPALAPASALVAGAALDAVGDPLLVINPDNLVAGAQHAGAVVMESAPPPLPVLVVDDSLTTRMLEQSILESAGYSVEVATSGEEGLRKARLGQYALFLVDVEMPGMDGFTFIEQVRADPALQHIPSILVTSRNAPEDRQRGQDVGAQAYVVKSEFDQGVLLEQIRTLVA